MVGLRIQLLIGGDYDCHRVVGAQSHHHGRNKPRLLPLLIKGSVKRVKGIEMARVCGKVSREKIILPRRFID